LPASSTSENDGWHTSNRRNVNRIPTWGVRMAKRFGATVTIDRPIDEVFAFLANGENDKRFSSRIIEIAKTTDGPPGVGTIFASTAKDGGIKAKHEFELTEFEAPNKIRWKELSKGPS